MSVIARISHTVFVVYLGVYVGSCTHKYDESGESVHLYVCACSGACMLTCVHTLCAYVLMHVDKCIHVEFPDAHDISMRVARCETDGGVHPLECGTSSSFSSPTSPSHPSVDSFTFCIHCSVLLSSVHSTCVFVLLTLCVVAR